MITTIIYQSDVNLQIIAAFQDYERGWLLEGDRNSGGETVSLEPVAGTSVAENLERWRLPDIAEADIEGPEIEGQVIRKHDKSVY